MKLYAGVIILQNNKIGLQKRDDKPEIVNPGMITAFGGTAEMDEDVEQVLKREFEEELGVDIDLFPRSFLGRFQKAEHDGSETSCHFWLVVDDHDLIKTAFEGRLHWFPSLAAALQETNMSPPCRWALEQVENCMET